MGCFIVSAAAAVGVGAAKLIVAHHEKKALAVENKEVPTIVTETKWSDRLKYLELTLWGGSILLAGEHVLHGEVVPFPPFLTAASDPEDTAVMLKEMGTVGVAMLGALVLAWGIGVFAYELIKAKKAKKANI